MSTGLIELIRRAREKVFHRRAEAQLLCDGWQNQADYFATGSVCWNICFRWAGKTVSDMDRKLLNFRLLAILHRAIRS
jgi:hypothetical protein